jgi:membrane protein YdbS with pleckstrin-like domain|tara:strand:- start:680 stop:913 length:234 start_codon:yes stop_codon:yes gene_type:complete
MEEVKPLRAGLLVTWTAVTLFLTVFFGFCVGFYFDYQDMWSWSNYFLTAGSILSLVFLILFQTAVLYRLEKYMDELD